MVSKYLKGAIQGHSHLRNRRMKTRAKNVHVETQQQGGIKLPLVKKKRALDGRKRPVSSRDR